MKLKKSKKSILILLIVLFSCGEPKTPKISTLVVATDASWPPMEYMNKEGTISGFDIDLIKEIGLETGIEIQFINIPWERIFSSLQNSECDIIISSVTITEERKRSMDFSNPYINAGQVILLRNNTQNVKNLSDLSGKFVGAQKGTTGAFEIEKVSSLREKAYDNINSAIDDLLSTEIDAVVCDSPIAHEMIRRYSRNKLKIAGEPFTNEYYGIAVKKSNPLVLDTINDGLKKVIKKGTIDKLKEKWFQ